MFSSSWHLGVFRLFNHFTSKSDEQINRESKLTSSPIISTHTISPIIPTSVPMSFATNTDFIAKTVSQVVQKAIMSKQTTIQKRKRVTNKGGQCLTNEAAMNLLEAEADAKKQKLIDSEIIKRDREEKRKKELEEKEQNIVLKALKKAYNRVLREGVLSSEFIESYLNPTT